jgi:hypothetical protein
MRLGDLNITDLFKMFYNAESLLFSAAYENWNLIIKQKVNEKRYERKSRIMQNECYG